MKESDEIGKADVGDSEFHERESDGINARESQKAIDQEGLFKEPLPLLSFFLIDECVSFQES